MYISSALFAYFNSGEAEPSGEPRYSSESPRTEPPVVWSTKKRPAAYPEVNKTRKAVMKSRRVPSASRSRNAKGADREADSSISLHKPGPDCLEGRENSPHPVGNRTDRNSCPADVLDIFPGPEIVTARFLPELFPEGLVGNLAAVRFPVDQNVDVLHAAIRPDTDEICDQLSLTFHLVRKAVSDNDLSGAPDGVYADAVARPAWFRSHGN